MDKYAKAFVKASMIYLGIGAMTGLCMVLWPDTRFTVTRVHTHINLLGFMAMMIYGVGYHILPRFMEDPCTVIVSVIFRHGLPISHSWVFPFLGFWRFLKAGSGTLWPFCLE